MSDFELDEQFRRVRRIGVRFDVIGVGGIYWAPSLAPYSGCNIVIGFKPEKVEAGCLDSVLVFCAGTGEFICEAWLLCKADSRYDTGDVRREHRNYCNTVCSVLKTYLPADGHSVDIALDVVTLPLLVIGEPIKYA